MAERRNAQVIVVGAGPAGSAAAAHLARAGIDVLLLEKSTFPRDKVCGDGLTPRGVHQLLRLGIDLNDPGWRRSRGVRVHCAGRQADVDWPAHGGFPDFGLTRTRHDFDHLLARHAQTAGARLHTGTKVTAPLTDAAGRLTGVTAVTADGAPTEFRAPLVIAADGASARTALATGWQRAPGRPLGTAIRRYYRTDAFTDDYLHFWADVRCAGSGADLPGYGWIFPLADNRVNVGLGGLPHRRHGATDLRGTLRQWVDRLPAGWDLDEQHADGPSRSAALPMGLTRRPEYRAGLLVIGDSAGMISPWNGEGIAQALEAAEIAADTIALALTRPPGPRREQALHRYSAELDHRWGRYYRLGNTVAAQLFSRVGYRPLVSRRIMTSPTAISVVLRLLSQATADPAQDGIDSVLNTVLRLVPPLRR
ncbi:MULTISPECIES: geranylgeranyl reductase family protein [Kitasatospora]|uniref:geranylgeranyl reductase family protein n=1 Tax=Kitasatospora TaxID=2063 RepID=UPI000C704B52|nr:geranylgeranyl reductase family protein [Kitasatospora sp. GP30]MDH6144325.1 geranylgeranyl reductase family protein [Kitasatospora sp. GP30]